MENKKKKSLRQELIRRTKGNVYYPKHVVKKRALSANKIRAWWKRRVRRRQECPS